MKKNLIVSLTAVFMLVACGKQPSQTVSTSENDNTVEQSTVVAKEKGMSSQTKAKIEKWKKEIYKDFPSKRLSSSDFEKYNLSNFWQTSYSLGYIGSNYQRMYMTFEKVRKISSTEYEVSGFSQVKSNVCRFTGTFKNLEFNQAKSFEDKCGDCGTEYVSSQGFVFGEFIISEDESQKSTGIFQGILMLKWCINENGQVQLSNLGLCGDSEENNQFLGEWCSYNGGTPKAVAWGDGRIPLTRSTFDIGDGEFVPDPKYVNNGWEEFKRD
jgi:hypothetical protein